MKKLIIAGNVTKDIEIRKIKTADSEISVATISVAVNEKDNEAVFFDVEVWRGLADVCAKNLAKGSGVSIIAEVKSNSYEKDGKKVNGYKFVADEVQFMGGKKN